MKLLDVTGRGRGSNHAGLQEVMAAARQRRIDAAVATLDHRHTASVHVEVGRAQAGKVA